MLIYRRWILLIVFLCFWLIVIKCCRLFIWIYHIVHIWLTLAYSHCLPPRFVEISVFWRLVDCLWLTLHSLSSKNNWRNFRSIIVLLSKRKWMSVTGNWKGFRPLESISSCTFLKLYGFCSWLWTSLWTVWSSFAICLWLSSKFG